MYFAGTKHLCKLNMKKILLPVIALLVAAFAFQSCKKSNTGYC
jgi:hypothetical protein